MSGFWQSGDARASRCHAAACGRQAEIQVGQGMRRNTVHAPDAVQTCRESVAAVQIGSERRTHRSPGEIGFGIWTVYLGEVKVVAHQKV